MVKAILLFCLLAVVVQSRKYKGREYKTKRYGYKEKVNFAYECPETQVFTQQFADGTSTCIPGPGKNFICKIYKFAFGKFHCPDFGFQNAFGYDNGIFTVRCCNDPDVKYNPDNCFLNKDDAGATGAPVYNIPKGTVIVGSQTKDGLTYYDTVCPFKAYYGKSHKRNYV